jgi:hypothetical protein
MPHVKQLGNRPPIDVCGGRIEVEFGRHFHEVGQRSGRHRLRRRTGASEYGKTRPRTPADHVTDLARPARFGRNGQQCPGSSLTG